jgi:hypothetical protein
MDTQKENLIKQCDLASEYYLFAILTFNKKSIYTKKYKKEFVVILNKLAEIDPEYMHLNPDEKIDIDYKKFNLDIDLITRKMIDDMTGIEMNAICHSITGCAIQLYEYFDSWNQKNRTIFSEDHGAVYRTNRRLLLLQDLLI